MAEKDANLQAEEQEDKQEQEPNAQETQENEPKDEQNDAQDEKDWKSISRDWEKKARKSNDQAQELSKQLEEVQKEREKLQALADELTNKLSARDEADKHRNMLSSVAKEYDVPVELLQGDDEEAVRAFAEKLVEYAKPKTAPTVKGAGSFDANSSVSSDKLEFVRDLFPGQD